jgi:hypothetical protein
MKQNKMPLGGQRLGSGKKIEVELEDFGYSEHNLSNVFRSTMSAGTLIPFMCQPALPGDEWNIKLNADCKTLPTIAPVFGSFKIQIDTFIVPMRLYNSWIHNNKLGIGMNMSQIKNPFFELTTVEEQTTWNQNNPTKYPINNAHILKYLGISGVGRYVRDAGGYMTRNFNAIPLLGYWDIFKNYYANKQEDKAYVISTDTTPPTYLQVELGYPGNLIDINLITYHPNIGDAMMLQITPTTLNTNIQDWLNTVQIENQDSGVWEYAANMFQGQLIITSNSPTVSLDGSKYYAWIQYYAGGTWQIQILGLANKSVDYLYSRSITSQNYDQQPNLYAFDLTEIDTIREDILKTDGNIAYNLSQRMDDLDIELAKRTLPEIPIGGNWDSVYKATLHPRYSQTGLLLKTYQSDIFNNWLNEELFTGSSGITELTSINVSSGYLTIDALELGYKVYKMLNQIAVSGGSYDDWQIAVYNHERFASPEIPMYMGGLSKELVFDELWSTAGVSSAGNTGQLIQPLGTLAGKGKMGHKHKGGDIQIHVHELSYIIGIVSLTPRLDYSQGNDWFTTLATYNDWHKPHLDQIGFEDLLAERMAWFGTTSTNGTTWKNNAVGKQPAWINYMTNYNRDFGLFAEELNLMSMVINRRYQMTKTADFKLTGKVISDLTTYVEPNLYNYLFAYTKLDGQNFWMQILNECTVRRKMSAKIMPNL